MTMTDPVADFLTRLRNANSAHHETVSAPYSKLKGNIAQILKSEGYIADYKVTDAEVGKTITVDLKFGPTASVQSLASSAFQSQVCAFTRRAPSFLAFSAA